MAAEPPSNPRLLRAFACSFDDLVANRGGSLTTRQQQLLAQHIAIGSTSSRIAIWMFLGSAAFLLIGAPFLINEGPIPQQVLPYFVGTVLVVLGIVGVFVGIGMRRVQLLRRAHISVIEGPIRRTTKRIRQARWIAYYLWIGGMRFQLTSEQQWEVFVEGRTYRIYYIHYPPTQLILSLEEAQG
jgi:hypothetical protein